MPKARTSAEERILQFFNESPLEVAQVVLNLAKSVVKARLTSNEAVAEPVKKQVRRRRRQPKASAAVVQPDNMPPGE